MRLAFALAGALAMFAAVPAAAAEKAAGKTYYVDAEKGDDANPGSEDQPWKTIGKAGQVAKAGEMVLIRGGVYRETLRPKNSGTEERPIVFKAADPKAPPILDGGEVVKEWKKHKGSIWVAEIGFAPNAMFQGDRKLLPALWPSQSDPYDPYDLSKMILVKKAGKDIRAELIDPEHLKQPAGTFDGARLLLYDDRNNGCRHIKITGYDKAAGKLTIEPNKWWMIGERVPEGKCRDRYAIGHCLYALNDPGEWFVDRKVTPHKVYLRTYKDADPNEAAIAAAKLAHAVNLRRQDLQNVVFDGFVMRYFHNPGKNWKQRAMIAITHGTHRNITIRNCTIYHNHHSAICEVHAEGIVYENNHIYHNEAGNALALARGKNGKFLRNHIHHNVGDGLWLGTGGKHTYAVSDVEIRGNHLHDHSSRKTHSDNLQIYKADNVLIAENVFEKQGGQNMWCSLNGKLTFVRNVFITGIAGMNNARELYVYNNVFYRSTLRWDAWHKQSPEEYRTKTFRCHNNIVIESGLGLPNCGLEGMDIRGSHNWYDVKNRWAQTGWRVMESYAAIRDKLPEEIRFDQKRLVHLNPALRKKYGMKLSEHSLVGVEPKFADVEKRDFHLKPGSPLIDAGLKVGLPFEGAAPDIGPYEAKPAEQETKQ